MLTYQISKPAIYKAMDAEYRCFYKFDSARSDSVINKRIAEYEKVKRVVEEKKGIMIVIPTPLMFFYR